MYLSKRVIAVTILFLAIAALFITSMSNNTQTVDAQEEVTLYNSRYIFVGDSDSPAIFDTATGVIRVWDKYPDRVVKSYNFEDHKNVTVDTINYK